MNSKKILMVIVLVFIMATPVVTKAVTQGELLAQIQSLLSLITSLQQQLTTIKGNSTTTVNPTTVVQTPTCPILSKNLWLGSRGASVYSLQKFLSSEGEYTYPVITGYYGPITQQAVQFWQAKNGVVSYGTPYTTGFGVVGPATRAAITRSCNTITPINPSVCTLEYTPVCGSSYGEQQTYGNSCQLKVARAQYLYAGRCRANTISNSPVINGFTGPTTLGIGQTGTWKINASDPQNGPLNYSIDWGDNWNRPLYSATGQSSLGFTQSTTLTHSYRYAGTYTISIIVRDNQNLTAKVTTTVHISGTTPTNSFSVTPTSGNAPLIVSFSGSVQSAGYSIDFGDGTTSGDINCSNGGCPIITPSTTPRTTVNISHVYKNAGTYTAKLRRHFALNEANCAGVDCNVVGRVTITVNGNPTTNTFSATPTSGDVPLSVKFSWTKDALGYSGACPTLEFGNGVVSSSIDSCPLTTTYLYTTPGTYIAKLTKLARSGNREVVGTATVTVGSSGTSLNVYSPSGGTYTFGANIPVKWSTNVSRNDVGMYLVLQDKNGSAIKSQKVNMVDGKAIIKTDNFCNNFFSDAIDGNCNGFKNSITKNSFSGFTVKGVIYTPKNACFGYCPPNLRGQVTNVASSVSKPFNIRLNNITTSNPLNITIASTNAPLAVGFTWKKPIGPTYFGGLKINYGDGSSSPLGIRPYGLPENSIVIKDHTYANPGTYTAQIIGIGEGRNDVLATAKVVLMGSISTKSFSVSPISGNTPLTVTATISLPLMRTLQVACFPTLVGIINWGDGFTSRTTRLNCNSQVITATHTYSSAGIYSVKLINVNGSETSHVTVNSI